jgi:hypothetical protein
MPARGKFQRFIPDIAVPDMRDIPGINRTGGDKNLAEFSGSHRNIQTYICNIMAYSHLPKSRISSREDGV